MLCGDLNMAACCLVPQLRDRGVQVETAACYFWKDEEGEPCMDSCGIWFVECPGMYKLCQPLQLLHDRDGGILHKEAPVQKNYRNQVPGNKDDIVYFRHPQNGGPGKRLSCYLPKTTADVGSVRKGEKKTDIPIKDRIAALLTPSDSSKERVQRRESQLQSRQHVILILQANRCH